MVLKWPFHQSLVPVGQVISQKKFKHFFYTNCCHLGWMSGLPYLILKGTTQEPFPQGLLPVSQAVSSRDIQKQFSFKVLCWNYVSWCQMAPIYHRIHIYIWKMTIQGRFSQSLVPVRLVVFWTFSPSSPMLTYVHLGWQVGSSVTVFGTYKKEPFYQSLVLNGQGNLDQIF